MITKDRQALNLLADELAEHCMRCPYDVGDFCPEEEPCTWRSKAECWVAYADHLVYSGKD